MQSKKQLNPPEKSHDCIVVEDVAFSYHKEPVLEDISFRIEYGDYVGIVGPNGGGKTTMLKILLGLLPLQKGTVRMFDRPVGDKKALQRVGYVPQRVAFGASAFPGSVEEVVKSGRTPRLGVFRPWRKADTDAVEQAIALTSIGHLRYRLIGQLSGGERQRVFIARALAAEPELLILDEPTVGVDMASKEAFETLLTKLNTDYGLTILLVSHDVESMAEQVKHILCFNRTLVCHLCSEDFVKENYFDRLYGKRAAHIHHPH